MLERSFRRGLVGHPLLYGFGDCRLDPERRELVRDGVTVPVEPQVFDLILYLIHNRDRVVTRDEIIAAVWGGRIVSESTLATRIHAARQAIGDSGEVQGLIKTVQRKGVRFVGRVDEGVSASAPIAAVPLARAPRHRWRIGAWSAAGVIGFVVAGAALSGVWRTTPANTGRTPQVFKDCDGCPEMVRLPAGEFLMGSPLSEPGRVSVEGEPRRVIIKQPFALGRFEITVGQFAAFLEDTGTQAADKCGVVVSFETINRTKDPQVANFRTQPGYEVTEKHPTGCINWHDAQAYVAWLRRRTGKPYRLPTEAEWEYAARAGSITSYSFGNNEAELCAHARFADLSTPFAWRNACRAAEALPLGAAPIGSFKPNPFGLHDMHGNVWEWVEDCWTTNMAEAPTDGGAFIRPGPCEVGVIRGGSWAAGFPRLRSAARDSVPIARRDQNMGFRVSLPIGP